MSESMDWIKIEDLEEKHDGKKFLLAIRNNKRDSVSKYIYDLGTYLYDKNKFIGSDLYQVKASIYDFACEIFPPENK